MNIIIANTQEFNPQIGGVERISSMIASELLKNGHSVYFVACRKSIYGKEYTPVTKQILLSNKNSYYNEINFNEFFNFVINNKIDIILNQAGNILEFTELCGSVCKKANIPLISAVHTDPYGSMKMIKEFKISKIYKDNILKILRRIILYPYRYFKVKNNTVKLYTRVAKVSNKIVLLSPSYENKFIKLIDEKFKYKIESIMNPCPFENEISTKEKKKVVLFVGRLNFSEKRPDRIIEVWERLYAKYPEWKLKIVGDGPLLSDLKEYVKYKSIKNIEFMGMCNPQTYYEEAEIICSTSNIEGMPMVLIEGIYFGCIPISFDNFDSIHDIIENNRDGIIVTNSSINEYTKKLSSLLESNDKRDKFRQNINKKRDEFNKDYIISKWEKLFERTVEEV